MLCCAATNGLSLSLYKYAGFIRLKHAPPLSTSLVPQDHGIGYNSPSATLHKIEILVFVLAGRMLDFAREIKAMIKTA